MCVCVSLCVFVCMSVYSIIATEYVAEHNMLFTHFYVLGLH